MSKLFVDEIQPKTTGGTVSISGTTIQTALTLVATKDYMNNNATADGVDTVVVSEPFTPKFANSKILVNATLWAGQSNFNGGLGIKVTVGGSSSFIGVNQLGSYLGNNTVFSQDDDGNASPYAQMPYPMIAIDDTVSSTSPRVYTITFHSTASNETLYVNRPKTNETNGFNQSSILLQEIVT